MGREGWGKSRACPKLELTHTALANRMVELFFSTRWVACSHIGSWSTWNVANISEELSF